MYDSRYTITLYDFVLGQIKLVILNYSLYCFTFSMIRGYTMDVICSTGFGLDASAQRDPDNPFIKHAKSFIDVEPAGKPLFMLASKSLFIEHKTIAAFQ